MIDIAQLTSADVGRWVLNRYMGYDGMRGRVTGYTPTHIMVRYQAAGGTLQTRPVPTRPEELEWEDRHD